MNNRLIICKSNLHPWVSIWKNGNCMDNCHHATFLSKHRHVQDNYEVDYAFTCLFVIDSKITQINFFWWNMVEGWGMAQERTRWIMVQIWIQELFKWFLNISKTENLAKTNLCLSVGFAVPPVSSFCPSFLWASKTYSPNFCSLAKSAWTATKAHERSHIEACSH